jgi:hypothetical protein
MGRPYSLPRPEDSRALSWYSTLSWQLELCSNLKLSPHLALSLRLKLPSFQVLRPFLVLLHLPRLLPMPRSPPRPCGLVVALCREHQSRQYQSRPRRPQSICLERNHWKAIAKIPRRAFPRQAARPATVATPLPPEW